MIVVGLETRGHHLDGEARRTIVHLRGGRLIHTYRQEPEGEMMCAGGAHHPLEGGARVAVKCRGRLHLEIAGVGRQAARAAGRDQCRQNRGAADDDLRALQEASPKPQLRDRAHVHPDENASEGSVPSLHHARPKEDGLNDAVAHRPHLLHVHGHQALSDMAAASLQRISDPNHLTATLRLRNALILTRDIRQLTVPASAALVAVAPAVALT